MNSDESRKDFSMGYKRGQLLTCMLLLIGVAGCSKPPSPNTPSANSPSADATTFNLRLSCSGGGGQRTCVIQNATDNKMGPFDLAIECVNERGVSMAGMLVENDKGLEPRGEWSFDLTVPTQTRSIRIGRVIPRSAR